MHTLSRWDPDQARGLISSELRAARAFLGDDGPDATAMLPVLHALQARFGYLHAEATALIADALNVSKAEVKGVISFYADLRTAPPGQHTVSLCRAEACQARGADAVAAHLEHRHGLTPGVTVEGVTLESASCLGNCALGPTALVDASRVVGRLDLPAADQLLARLKERAP